MAGINKLQNQNPNVISKRATVALDKNFNITQTLDYTQHTPSIVVVSRQSSVV